MADEVNIEGIEEADALQEALKEAEQPLPSLASNIRLSGLQKAAILLVTMGPERASELMRYLDLDESEPLVIEVAHLQNVAPEYVQVVMNEIIETSMARGYFYEGGIKYARAMLNNAFGTDKAEEMLGRLQAVIETRPFKFLLRTPPEQIYSFIKREHPQLIALLLAYLPDTQSGHILQYFEAEEQADIVRRISTMGRVTPEMVSEVEATIRSKMHIVSVRETATTGGVESAAGLINRVDRQTERNVFDNLQETDPELAEELRALLFVFEDIIKLDNRAIQAIVQRSEQSDLTLALRGASPQTHQTFFENMSDRMAETIREEMEIMPPQRRKDVEEAQTRIVAVARQLEEAGEIQIFRGSEADEVV